MEMKIKENKDMINALAKQRKELTASKEAAKSLLIQLGIYDLLVPIESKKSKPISA
jgi:4'-phosphopantetheinyl transferase EntD